MQTQQPDTEPIDAQHPTSHSKQPGRNRWLTGFGAFLVVLVVIVSSVVVFALAGQGHKGLSNNPTGQPSGQWKAVKQGYLFLSLTAVASDPSVLYACATTSDVVSNQGTSGQVTILRSADMGTTWQDIGANQLSGTTCQLAVNPSNSDDLYAFTDANTTQTSGALKHSTDGGHTWQAIQPTITSATTAASPIRYLQQLQFSGSTLYAVGWSYHTPPIVAPSAASQFPPHLLKSTDGGHTWAIIDTQIYGQGVQTWSYAVSPSDANTLYTLVGRPAMPVEQVPPKGAPTQYGISQQLYKTTDGGASWALLLSNVPYASQVQLASNNPNIVYVGGIAVMLPLAVQSETSPQNTLPERVGGFHLQVSTNGGTNWSTVATTSNEDGVQSWFVSADGYVYTAPAVANNSPGVTGTGVAATVIVGTVLPVQNTPYSTGTNIPNSEPPVIVSPPPSNVHSVSQGQTTINTSPKITVPTPGPATVERYDPSNTTWSKVTTPPVSGQLLKVTPAGTNGGDILWYMGITGTQSTQFTLYRYIV